MRLILIATCLFASLVSASEDAVGNVLLSTGGASILRQNQLNEVNIKRGDQLYQGDIVNSRSGVVVVRMKDGALIRMRENSKLEIVEYQAASPTNKASIKFNLLEGAIRTKTGEIGTQNPDRYRLNTPFAALGIRGTDYTVEVDGKNTNIFVHEGGIAVSPIDGDKCRKDGYGECLGAVLITSGSNAWYQATVNEIVRIEGMPTFILPDWDEADSIVASDDLGSRLIPDQSVLDNLVVTASFDINTMDESQNGGGDFNSFEYTLSSGSVLNLQQLLNFFSKVGIAASSYIQEDFSFIHVRMLGYPTGELSLWFLPDKELLWGEARPMASFLKAGEFTEGEALYSKLTSVFNRLGFKDSEWLEQLSSDKSAYSSMRTDDIQFTFQMGSELDSSGVYQSLWSQPTNTDIEENVYISSLKINQSLAEVEVNFGEASHVFRGVISRDGVLFAEDNEVQLKGVFFDEEALVAVSNKSLKKSYVLGLKEQDYSDLFDINAAWVKRNSQNVEWGHWSDYALSVLSGLESAEPGSHWISNDRYGLKLPNVGDSIIAAEGVINFALSDYSAVHLINDDIYPAEVVNGTLKADFDRDSFALGFDVSSPKLLNTQAIYANGSIANNGLAISNASVSNANVTGFIDMQQINAGFLFDKTLTPSESIFGITIWK